MILDQVHSYMCVSFGLGQGHRIFSLATSQEKKFYDENHTNVSLSMFETFVRFN